MNGPRNDWLKAFKNIEVEYGFRPLDVEGEIPTALNGTLYRVGPSLFENSCRRYGHPFDGDGALSAVRFENGRASGAVSLIQTEGLRKEQKAGRSLYGGWGTPVPGPMRGFQSSAKNPANTSIFRFNQKFYALFEGGPPTEFDPDDLSTIGVCDFNGEIKASFSAHPRYNRSRKTFYNFGARYGLLSYLDLYCAPPGKDLRRIGTIRQPGPSVIHDFALTENYLVFIFTPVRINLYKAAFGRRPMLESFSYKKERGVTVVVVPIEAPHKPISFKGDDFHLWHFANAFEQDGNIIADAVIYPDFSTNDWFGGLVTEGPTTPAGGRLARLEIDLKKQTIKTERTSEISVEFPSVNPDTGSEKHRFIYMVGHSDKQASYGWWDNLLKMDAESGAAEKYELPPGCYPSEPIFVGAPGAEQENNGWLICWVYESEADRTRAYIYRAEEKTAVAKIDFGAPIPFTFHGLWAQSDPTPG